MIVPCSQPVAGSQLSAVQESWSSQSGAAPRVQVPPEQTSGPLQTVSSSHAFELFAYTQPVAGLQESSVQSLPSSQLLEAPPAHAPLLQASGPVQALPSSHGAVLLVYTHPTPAVQLSSVHALRSSHPMAV